MRLQYLRCAVTGLALVIAFTASASIEARADRSDTVVQTKKSPYTDKEYRCMALTMWHEGGSTYATPYELRLIGHTIVVRSRARDWYQRSDWGGPDICAVVHKKAHGVCQYSYWCTGHARENPFSGFLWEEVKASLMPALGRATEKDLWDRTKRAAREVLDGWEPEGDMVLADTYLHKCSTEFAPADCSSKVITSRVTKCWFAIEQLMIEGQSPVPEDRKHIFYRRPTLNEVKVSINDVPRECHSADAEEQKRMNKTLEVVREARKEWIEHPDRPLVASPPGEDSQSAKRHKKQVRHSPKHKKSDIE